MHRQINTTGNGVLSKSPPHTLSSNSSAEVDHRLLTRWLIEVAENRDTQAFAQLFTFFTPKILRIAKTKLAVEAQCNEVVQETMTKVWRKAHLFDANKGAATTWVYTVMRNVIFDMLRKIQANKEDTLSDDIWPIAEQAQSDHDNFVDHIENRQLMSVIQTLPEQQQQVIKGFYFSEMSQEQLAAHLNVPLGTIKSRLRLALAKLKAQIDSLGDLHD